MALVIIQTQNFFFENALLSQNQLTMQFRNSILRLKPLYTFLHVCYILLCFDTSEFSSHIKNGKVIPLQARCDPEGGYSYSFTLP